MKLKLKMDSNYATLKGIKIYPTPLDSQRRTSSAEPNFVAHRKEHIWQRKLRNLHSLL